MLVNRERPLEATVMISHAWAENAERFVDVLERSVHPDEPMFICAFSIFQNEDGSGPSIAEQIGKRPVDSPFYQVLKSIDVLVSTNNPILLRWGWLRDLMPLFVFLIGFTLISVPILFAQCIPFIDYCTWFDPNTDLWVWERLDALEYRVSIYIGFALMVMAPLGQVYLHWFPSYHGRMVVVPNRNCDIYQRLWCVYEIFTASFLEVPIVLGCSLAHAGTCSCREADCSSQDDKETIRGEIARYGLATRNDPDKGYDAVDRTIRRTMRHAWMPLVVALMFKCFLVGYTSFLWPVGSRKLIDPGIPLLPGHVIGNTLGAAVHYCSGFLAAWKDTGHFSTATLLKLLAGHVATGAAFFILGFAGLEGWQCDWYDIIVWKANLTAFSYNFGMYMLAMAPVIPGALLFRHILKQLGLNWELWAALGCSLAWLLAATSYGAVHLDANSWQPSLFLMFTALLISCGPIMVISLVERWGVRWAPKPGQARWEGAMLSLGMLAAMGLGWGCGGLAVLERVMRCADVSDSWED